MGLVDYSDSESETEAPQIAVPTKPTLAPPTKKPFQKLVDKANPGKILVNLPSSAPDDATPSGEPAAKRIKTGGSRFSGFGSFLPPPKTIIKPATGTKTAPKVGINLKTSSEAAFSRGDANSAGGYGDAGDDASSKSNDSGGLGLNLPPSHASAASQLHIQKEREPETEIKILRKQMTFKPLSVARKPARKTAIKAPAASKTATPSNASVQELAAVRLAPSQAPIAPPPPQKPVSLFSFGEDGPTVEAAPDEYAEYEPEFTRYDNSAYAEAQQQYASYSQPTPSSSVDPNSLDSIADDLNLDPAARRELFGRGGGGSSKATAKSVINFSLDKEYQHNEELRASGALDQQKHNPLRAIKPGKHSLQQLVNQVQSQKDALEENFAKNRSTQKQASSRYGWR